MKDTGETEKRMVKDVLFTLMGTYTLVPGGKIKPMVLVSTPIKMVPDTRVTGKKTNNTVKV